MFLRSFFLTEIHLSSSQIIPAEGGVLDKYFSFSSAYSNHYPSLKKISFGLKAHYRKFIFELYPRIFYHSAFFLFLDKNRKSSIKNKLLEVNSQISLLQTCYSKQHVGSLIA